MQGVMDGFASGVVGTVDAQLALVGPSVEGVTDDPEGAEVLDECIAAWKALPSEARRRIRLVTLPMDDVEENAVMVNAIQRQATVIVQKSIVEGFGLTVAEGMWKAKPVVASAVGGILDQIAPGTGILLDDPKDLDAFGAAAGRPAPATRRHPPPGRERQALRAEELRRRSPSAAVRRPHRATRRRLTVGGRLNVRLLVANRGEIAIRILRAAAELGIRPSPSTPRTTPRRCTSAGPTRPGRCGARASAAYLDAEQLLAVAGDAGCDAIHPGYGFLSEDAGFARRCAEAGLTFVGPRPEMLELFGDKVRGRALAEQLRRAGAGRHHRRRPRVEQARAFLASLGPRRRR